MNIKIALLAQLLDAAVEESTELFTDTRRIARRQGLSQARDLFRGVFGEELGLTTAPAGEEAAPYEEA